MVGSYKEDLKEVPGGDNPRGIFNDYFFFGKSVVLSTGIVSLKFVYSGFGTSKESFNTASTCFIIPLLLSLATSNRVAAGTSSLGCLRLSRRALSSTANFNLLPAAA